MEEKSKQYIRMTETPIPKLVLSLAVPSIISMLVTSFYNMADTYFVSHLSMGATAAVGIVFSIQSLMQAVGFGVGMGAGSLISRHLGMRDKKSAEKYAASALAVAFLFGILLLIWALLDIDNLMRLFGAKGEVLEEARDYGLFILIGAPVMCASFVLNNILKAEGKANLAMIGLTAGGLLNVFLDPIFIYNRFFIFSGLNLGAKGAAIATIASQTVSFIILLMILRFAKTEIKLNFKLVSVHFSDYYLIIKTGLPTVFRQGLASVSSTMINRACVSVAAKSQISAAAIISAVTISTKLYMIARNALIGIGQAFQPVAGYNYGAKRYDRVKKAFWFATACGTGLMLLATALFFTRPVQLISLFGKGKEDFLLFRDYGAQGLKFFCISLPFLAYSTYVNQLFQSLGKVKRASLLASCRNGLFYIPLVFILPPLFRIEGLLLVQPIADCLTFFFAIPFQVAFLNELRKEEELLNEQ